MQRQQKITLGEMRESGPTRLIVHCGDYKCGHSIVVDANRWGHDVRLSHWSRDLRAGLRLTRRRSACQYWEESFRVNTCTRPLSARYNCVRARFEHHREELEMKIFLTALSFVFFSSVVLPTTASAGIMDGKGNCSGGVCTNKGVPCPAGTCSKTGTSMARDVKNCSAKNCTGGSR
jgi:hypothetical protein